MATVTISNDHLTAKILHKGAELCSVKNNTGLEFIWQADAAVWPRHAPVLFPIVGRLNNDRFTYRGRSYNLGQHGFARDREFTPVSQTADSCTFVLRSDDKSRGVYPFDFELTIGYRLERNKLNVSYQVNNPSTDTLHFSIGGHPGFRCPLLDSESYDDYCLEFDRTQLMQSSLSNGLRSGHYKMTPLEGNRLRLSPTLFDDDALVFGNGQVSRIALRSSKSGHGVEMECEGWPYFGVWAKKGCTRFVCLEPWQGVADRLDATGKLEEKEGIIKLLPGESFLRSHSISFK